MTTAQEIRSNLPYFTGTKHYYAHAFLDSDMVLTDGAAYIREQCGAYWLFDLIAQQYLQHRADYFTARLTHDIDSDHWIFSCTNQRSEYEFYRQVIPWSDFPLPEIALWVEGSVCLLPSEH